jgi:hypothetical protein
MGHLRADFRLAWGMAFHPGEEVLFDGARFVIWGIEGGRYRLLACGPGGASIRYANANELSKIESYTRARDDTDLFVRNR